MALSPEAERFRREVELKRLRALEAIKRIPIAVLIWGANPRGSSPAAKARVQLRDVLVSNGHLAQFSEDLMDPSSGLGILAQQMAQVEAHDLVFSIPDSFGSMAEIHDFARLPWLSHKIIAFLDRAHNGGYANQTLLEIQARITCGIELYDGVDSPGCIIDKALASVRRLQEIYYLAGRRA